MEITYREQLDKMLQGQFGNNREAHLELTPKPNSHAKHGLLVYYQNGRLHIICGKCKQPVAVIAVASEPNSTSLPA